MIHWPEPGPDEGGQVVRLIFGRNAGAVVTAQTFGFLKSGRHTGGLASDTQFECLKPGTISTRDRH